MNGNEIQYTGTATEHIYTGINEHQQTAITGYMLFKTFCNGLFNDQTNGSRLS